MRITIKSRQKDVDENYSTNEYDGYFDVKEDRFFIRYTEKLIQEDSPASGAGKTGSATDSGPYRMQNNDPDHFDRTAVRTLIKVSGKTAEVTRTGAINSRMVFTEGEALNSIYPTPYGNFDAEVFTRKLRVRQEDDTFRLRIFYDLTLNGAFISECEYDLTVHVSDINDSIH